MYLNGVELVAAETQVPLPAVSLLSPANGAVSNAADVTFSATVTAPAGLSIDDVTIVR